MVELYTQQGMSHEDATLVVSTMAKYKEFFVDVMMTQELQLQVPEEDHVEESMKEGCVMFASFAFFGALPLLGYVVIPILFPELSSDFLFTAACIGTGCVLFFMGTLKSLVTSQHWIRAGTETLLLGGACATVAYTIGTFVQKTLGYGLDEA